MTPVEKAACSASARNILGLFCKKKENVAGPPPTSVETNQCNTTTLGDNFSRQGFQRFGTGSVPDQETAFSLCLTGNIAKSRF